MRSNRIGTRFDACVDGLLVASLWWGSLRSPPPYGFDLARCSPVFVLRQIGEPGGILGRQRCERTLFEHGLIDPMIEPYDRPACAGAMTALQNP
jgi:hypothetical protein